MRKRGKPQIQSQMFPAHTKPTAQEFSQTLLGRKLISKTHRKRQGKPRTISVIKEVEKAYRILERIKGINFEGLIKFFAESKSLEVELIMRNTAIVSAIQRELSEVKLIRRALAIIAKYVGMKRKHVEQAKLHYNPAARAEKAQESAHMESIGGKELKPGNGHGASTVEKPEKLLF
jgi:site-specific recombinase